MGRNPSPVAEIKHKKFAREFAKTGNGALSYSKVYPAAMPASAASCASELLKKPEVKQEILSYAQAIAEKIGPKVVAKSLAGLVRAKKGVFYEGKRMDSEPDNPTRIAAVRTVLQTQGALIEKDNGPAAVAAVNVQINLA